MIKKILIGVVALVAIVFLVGMFYGKSIVKSSVEDYGPDYTGTTVKLEDVSFMPFSGNAGLSGFEIGSPAGFDSPKTFSLKDVSVNMEPMAVFDDPVHIKEIRITDPEIFVEYKKGKLNINALMDNIAKYSPPSEDESTTNVIIDDLYITGAKINVVGLPVGEDGPLELPDIHLQDIGNKSGAEEGVTFSAATEETMKAVTNSVTKILANNKIQELLGGGGSFLKDTFKGIFGGGDEEEETDDGEG